MHNYTLLSKLNSDLFNFLKECPKFSGFSNVVLDGRYVFVELADVDSGNNSWDALYDYTSDTLIRQIKLGRAKYLEYSEKCYRFKYKDADCFAFPIGGSFVGLLENWV